MAKFKGAVLECQICGKWFKVPQCRAHKATTCSHECSVVYRAKKLSRAKVKMRCPVCGMYFYEHLSISVHRVYCSNECRYKSPTYGEKLSDARKGDRNPMWKGGVVSHADGYLYESVQDHPFTKTGYVFQHRLVAERHLKASDPTSEYLVTIDGESYLSPEFHVHHKNFDRTDNRIENLEVMTNGDHLRLHNQLRRA